jgi:hypothetical protein
MTTGQFANLPTSTSVERTALAANINLSDSHARLHHDQAILHAFQSVDQHFTYACSRSQESLETEFIAEFAEIYGLSFPRTPLLSYSTSCLAEVIGTFLGSDAKILWGIPSFDNIRDVVRTSGPRIALVPETTFIQIIKDPPPSHGLTPFG